MSDSIEPAREMSEATRAYKSLRALGFGTFSAVDYRAQLGAAALEQIPEVLDTFSHLSLDRQMGDEGTYRFRAFSRFLLRSDETGTISLQILDGHSIHQLRQDNPLNGGVTRTYEPLSDSVSRGPFLRDLIKADARHAKECDGALFNSPVVVGVHQVRILARSQELGLPTPEGIHRDAERFTFQHFMARWNIQGGEFRAYDAQKTQIFSWLQTRTLETVLFEGRTWHSASPISLSATSSPDSTSQVEQGHRDIFLVDFDSLEFGPE